MQHISEIMANMVSNDTIFHFCPVEKRNVPQSYCDDLFCEMCGEDECLGYDPDVDEDNTDVDMDPSLIAGRDPADVRSDMNYELLCEKYFD